MKPSVLNIEHSPLLGTAHIEVEGKLFSDGREKVWRGNRPGPLISRATHAALSKGIGNIEVQYRGPEPFHALARMADTSGRPLRTIRSPDHQSDFANALMEHLRRQRVSAEKLTAVEQDLVRPSWYVAFVAPFSAGKSTLINACLGLDLLPTHVEPTTTCATTLVPILPAAEKRIRFQRQGKWQTETEVDRQRMKMLNREPGVQRILIDHPLFRPEMSSRFTLRLTDLPGPDCAFQKGHRNTLDGYLSSTRFDQVLFVTVPTKLQDQGEYQLLEFVKKRTLKLGLLPNDVIDVVMNQVDVLANDPEENTSVPRVLAKHRMYLRERLDLWMDPPIAVAGIHALLARKVLANHPLTRKQHRRLANRGFALRKDLSWLGLEPQWFVGLLCRCGLASTRQSAAALEQQSCIGQVENRISQVMHAVAPVRALRRAIRCSPRLHQRLSSAHPSTGASELLDHIHQS